MFIGSRGGAASLGWGFLVRAEVKVKSWLGAFPEAHSILPFPEQGLSTESAASQRKLQIPDLLAPDTSHHDHETLLDSRPQFLVGPASVCPCCHSGQSYICTSDNCHCLYWELQGPMLFLVSSRPYQALPSSGRDLARGRSATEWNADLVLYRLQPLPLLQHPLLAGQWFLH